MHTQFRYGFDMQFTNVVAIPNIYITGRIFMFIEFDAVYDVRDTQWIIYYAIRLVNDIFQLNCDYKCMIFAMSVSKKEVHRIIIKEIVYLHKSFCKRESLWNVKNEEWNSINRFVAERKKKHSDDMAIVKMQIKIDRCIFCVGAMNVFVFLSCWCCACESSESQFQTKISTESFARWMYWNEPTWTVNTTAPTK